MKNTSQPTRMTVDRPTEGAAARPAPGASSAIATGSMRMVSAGANTLIADADDLELDRAVTVKLVRPEIAESEEFRRRFARTMRAMAKLSHPNIAAVHDWGEEEVGKRTTVYAVVEHLSGGSLRDLFDRGRQLDPSQALVVGLEVCRGLDFAHRKNLVHGELPPSKLVFGDDRRLRIVDFGLGPPARPPTTGRSRRPSRPTSPATARPSRPSGQPIDGHADVYSLALILVEAVTGAVPFAARSTVATLSARVGRLMPVSADLGPLARCSSAPGGPTRPTARRPPSSGAASCGRPRSCPGRRRSRSSSPAASTRTPASCAGRTTRPAACTARRTSRRRRSCRRVAAPAGHRELAAAAERGRRRDVADARPADRGRRRRAGRDGAATSPAPRPRRRRPIPSSRRSRTPPRSTPPAPPSAGPPRQAAATDLPPPPAPGGPTKLYDGDEDLMRDELAALAALPLADDAPRPPGPPTGTGRARQHGCAGRADRSADRGGPGGPTAAGRAAAAAAPSVGAVGARPRRGRRPRRRSASSRTSCSRCPSTPSPSWSGPPSSRPAPTTASFNWDIEVRHERSDDHPTPGEIIRTAPAAGQELAEDEPFLIVVSDGPEFRDLPDLTGLTQAEAETRARRAQAGRRPAGAAERRERRRRLGDLVVGARRRRR